MVGLNCISIAKTHGVILASSLSPSPSDSNLKSQPIIRLEKKLKKQNQRQLSVTEIERAIGAGVFRDRDTTRDAKENKTFFDSILSNSVMENEGDVEKKLRESGEWLLQKTEDNSASAGKQILVVVFQWILPVWIFAFLVASGVVKLPFTTPFLDDLLL